MTMLEINAVACSRKGTYDAEVQLRWGSYDKPQYKQILLSTGHASNKAAKEAASAFANALEVKIIAYALAEMAGYKDAKP